MYNNHPPSNVKNHDHRRHLVQEFDRIFPFLRSVNFNAQNTFITAAIRNKTKRHYRGAHKGEKEKNKRAPLGFRRSQAREVAGLQLVSMYL